MLDRATDFVNIRKVQTGVNSLAVKIERHIDQVQIARALAVAKQAAFKAVRTCHHGKLASSSAGTPVIVRVY